ncbi:transporter substrate-binding domain-containing protein [Desulforegula conservatrix]|uniref:transporter substrate-binding domain-containing protein n=1 Tax=Desulforegula conservatrix TaxID=153026 RepID=UPI0004291907|nr:transporter substrate-binding domain-containing protein [Desulforegula conservatrix]
MPSKTYSYSCILLFSFLALALIGICSVETAYSEPLPPKAENKIIIGDDHSYPPYAFLDENGQPSGFNIDISKALARELGIRVEIRLEPWSKVKTDLESGQIDAISGMFNMPERRLFFDFSTRHNISAYTLFVRAGSGIKKAGDAKNRELIVEKSDIGHDWAIANDFSKKIIPVPSITEALTLLAAGKHDAVLVGRMQGYYIIEKFKLQDLVAVEDNLFEMDYCFAVKKGNADLLDKLNTGLQILKSSGKYNEIYDKWFAVYETDNFILKAKSYLWLFKWVIVFLVFVFGGMWAWNFSLRRAVNTKIRNLNESEQRFKSIFEFSYDAMSVWDQEFRCAFVNSSAIDLFKIKEKIPSGADISSCFRHIPELGTILKGKIDRAFQTGQPIKSEDHFEVDGNIIFTESVFSPIRHYNSEVYAVVVICRDTTARKIAEARLAKSEAVFSKMVQNASDIFVIIKPDGVIRYVSPAIETITGFCPDELRKSILSITHPDDISIVEKAWKECTGNPLNAVKVEFRHAHKNGGFVHLEAIGQSFIDDPDINGVIATARSVEDRKTEEDKRIEMERQLLHTQKLESLGVLAGGIAHDFNNLLMAIMGYAELCSYEISAGSMASSHMNEILKASQRAAELCQQLLAYTGKGRFIIERINVDDVIRDMIPLLETCISKKANIALNLEANLPEMEADASQIRQIIMNLIINASEAIGDRNGLISISARKVFGGEIPPDSAFFSTVNPKSEYINLEISDNGCGMNQDTLSKIFEPFFTTKFTGRGLGMAAVQGIVKGHCGAILIQSEPEVGTVFNLYFPASLTGIASMSGSDQEMEVDESEIPHGKILLVDDEEIIRKVGTGMLEKLGFQVLTAQDGQEALSVYRRSRDEIACIILDLTMPVMDGEEAYNEFLKIDPDVRVIVASGYSETEISSMFSGKGLVRFIQKPFKVDALKRIIHRALE